MADNSFEIKAPVQWLPAGLISWYGADGSPVALVTSWIALIGGAGPRLRTAWHGRHSLLSNHWLGGDFVLNIPHEKSLIEIRRVMTMGQLCLKAEDELGLVCSSGVAAVAPRLLDCAVQIECVAGQLVDAGTDLELCGDVVRVHRNQVVVDPSKIPDLCAIQPLSSLE